MLEKFLDSKNAPFVIIYGEKGTGKFEHIEKILYTKNFDMLVLKDNGESIKIDDEENIGVHQIETWLQKTSFKDGRCVLIENIERLSHGAAQGFLKTLEQPGENNFILASCSNLGLLPDTVTSRAILIKHKPQKLENFDFDEYTKTFLGEKISLAKKVSQDENFQKTILETKNLEKMDLATRRKFFKTAQKEGYLEEILIGLMRICEKNSQYEKGQNYVKARKMLQDSGNQEAILFFLALC